MTNEAALPAALCLGHGNLSLPAFLPDATFGVVRAVDTVDVAQAGIKALMMNVFHLMQKPGTSTIQALGGLHDLTAWPHPIVTDSGGFQAYSLIRQNAKFGRLTERGIRFKPEGAKRDFQLTPEKSVQLQLSYGADIVTCLDDCTHVDDSPVEQRASVKRTIAWAKRCRAEFDRQLEQRSFTSEAAYRDRPPLLFGVVQGGGDEALRRECADALLEIGFDGFGYGGWPLDGENRLVADMLALTRSLVPAHLPVHALGIGHPHHIVTCSRLGYNMFDCALPTRDARRGRLYTFTQDPNLPDFRLRGEWFSPLYVYDSPHAKSKTSLSPGCDCHTCTYYSLAYIHHLAKSKDTLFYRLATIHNLRFMAVLMEKLQFD